MRGLELLAGDPARKPFILDWMFLQKNVPLGPRTTLGVGGPARWFVEVRTEDELREAVEWASSRQLPLFVLGGGSNLVIADSGFKGLTLQISLKGIERHEENGQVVFEAAAGEDWDTLVAQAVDEDCAGVECMSGIPGTVGGTPVQNVGAYGQDASDTIVRVRAFEIGTGKFLEFTNAECGFSYRKSRFNSSDAGRFIITRVTYALNPRGEPKLEYEDLKTYFADKMGTPSLRETREAVRAIRYAKGMLIVPGEYDSRSAGSFFKNPIVDRATFEHIAEQVRPAGLVPPTFPAEQGMVKIAAAWLVERSGVSKGFTVGPVSISRRHALAIVNRGGARAQDVIVLKNLIQEHVREMFKIDLVPEPVFVGFDER